MTAKPRAKARRLWFRVYNEMVDDPKVQGLSFELRSALINVWCLASKHDGLIPQTDVICFHFRTPKAKVLSLMQALRDAGFIDTVEDGEQPHGWDERQYASDVSTERVRKHRERKRLATETADETFHGRSRNGGGNVSGTADVTDHSRDRVEAEESKEDPTTNRSLSVGLHRGPLNGSGKHEGAQAMVEYDEDGVVTDVGGPF